MIRREHHETGCSTDGLVLVATQSDACPGLRFCSGRPALLLDGSLLCRLAREPEAFHNLVARLFFYRSWYNVNCLFTRRRLGPDQRQVILTALASLFASSKLSAGRSTDGGVDCRARMGVVSIPIELASLFRLSVE